jgi:hypothetical protein
MTGAESSRAQSRYQLGERAGVRVSVRLIELSGEGARRLRRRQLEAIVWLLRRAHQDQAERDDG